MSTIEEILEKIEQVELLDGSPNVEGPSLSITLDSAYNFNYEDAKGFRAGKWADETAYLADIVRSYI